MSDESHSAPQSIGFVIPVYNEVDTLPELHRRITDVIQNTGISEYHICFVDDGSSDGSWDAIIRLAGKDPWTCGLRLRRNFGKAEALQAGFSQLDDEIVFTMDADLQDDPNEIPKFLKKLAEGHDMVSGWKEVRHDPLNKTLPSKIFNGLARAASGLPLHDFNCGFKAYRQDVIQQIELFGELHRFIPILAHAEGYRVGEVSVKHHPREFGVSKYGSKRFLKGLLDLITVSVIARYMKRPAHIFGGTGLIAGVSGFSVLAWLSFSKIVFGNDIGGRPLFFLGILLMLLGAQLLSIGLIAEMITRINKAPTRRHISEMTGTHPQ